MLNRIVSLSALALCISACQPPSKDEQLRQVIQENDLKGKPVSAATVPTMDSSVAKLGRALFFSTELSGNGDVACVSCHHPVMGGGDDLSLPIGIDAIDPALLGPGRELDHAKTKAHSPGHAGPANVPRNSPSTFNVAHYKKALFWDGRVRVNETNGGQGGIITPDSLFSVSDSMAREDLVFAQSRFPVTSADEMLGYDKRFFHNEDIRRHIEQKLQKDETKRDAWLPAFRDAFDKPEATAEELITFVNISEAIAVYQRAQEFTNTPWKHYVEGDVNALTESQKRGALLFYKGSAAQQGKGASCASCHSGDFFTDEAYHNLAVPQIGPGKDKLDNDFGRKRVSRAQKDKYRFRTPTLLNVEVTGPFYHNGSYDQLIDVLKHHNAPAEMLEQYDIKQLVQFEGENTGELASAYPYIAKNTGLALKMAENNNELPNMNYSEAELKDIADFLTALTDPCVKDPACLKPFMLDGSEPEAWQLLKVRLRDKKLPQTRFVEAALKRGIEHEFKPRRVELPEKANVDDPKVARHINSNTHLNMTGGIAVGDINGDNLPDIFLPGSSESQDKLYLNAGSEGFKEIIATSGIDTKGQLSNGATFADITGNGLDDLMIGGVVWHYELLQKGGQQDPSSFSVWKNNGDLSFSEMSEQSGFSFTRNLFSTAFADYDRDGDLDMAAGSWYRAFTRDLEEPHLWTNQGNGEFVASEHAQGIRGTWESTDWTFTPNFADINNDGWLDLLFVSDFEQTQYFINEAGVFKNITDAAVITDENGMGTAVADYDNDGDLDWFVTSIYDPSPDDNDTKFSSWGTTGNRFYRNLGDGRFEDITAQTGLQDGGWGWASCMTDFDNDGDLDIFQVNGYLYDDHPAWLTFTAKFAHARPRLFINDGNGHFEDKAEEWGILPGEGRGISCTDFDRDGDVDILVQQLAKPTRLYLNQTRQQTDERYLGVRLDGLAGNPHASGARVYATIDGVTQMREIQIGGNYLSQNAAEAFFGLGKHQQVDELKIEWPEPNRKVQVLKDVAANQWLEIAYE